MCDKIFNSGVGMCIVVNWMPQDVCQLAWSKFSKFNDYYFCGTNIHSGPHFVFCELHDSKPGLA